ncbi:MULTISPECIES: hypothetical protein [Pseudomonas]|jgi:hypothetical protein|uniref:hypothetical protein n=1 Tax=Pseudomonas TaxID=286 RepID=UPI001240D2A0|nr:MULTISPECIES: hypothetical protein [Pseudomonas]MBV7524332.1 hypothetical protein [Pseudomonas sp. PDM29]VVM50236.1 hypothetical protein PS647_00761 [Pseudomonas fluorescens]
MSILKNFVAVDWRSGKDRCYFFFKDSNTYSRYNNIEDRIESGHPTSVTYTNWKEFHPHVRNLRFGFATTRIVGDNRLGWDSDILWLFYYDNGIPMVCEYDQDTDTPVSFKRVDQSIWAMLTPYFDKIITGTTWSTPFKNTGKYIFKFILNDGTYIHLDWQSKKPVIANINDDTWPGLAFYADDIITAVQIDADVTDSYLYIFLKANTYLKYNIDKNKLQVGPRDVGTNWPGLVHS